MLVYRLWMLGLLLFTGIHFGIKNGSANKSSDPGSVAFVSMNTNSQKLKMIAVAKIATRVAKAVDIKLKD